MTQARGLLIMFFALALQAGTRFDPLKDIALTVSGGALSVVIPSGVHLKVRMFRMALMSPGTLELDTLPEPSGQDEAGDPIWRGRVRVGLKVSGSEDPVRLMITYQPCTEGPNGMCYLPVKRTFTISLEELRGGKP